MKISFAATNPCHVYEMAQALHRRDALGVYYSGYPRWRLRDPGDLPIRAHSGRTLVTYASLRFIAPRFRPANRSLFLWQDRGFDRWAGRELEPCDFIHGIPGQCLELFRSAQRKGLTPVLNHATGPVRQWIQLLRPEYERAGLDLDTVTPYDAAYFQRETQEYALADYHCAASTVVRDQLVAEGIDARRIWVVPYGADPAIFHRRERRPPERFTIAFAGQIGLRKGLRTFLETLTQAGGRDWAVDFYGPVLPEARPLLAAYDGVLQPRLHGPVSQRELAEAFRRSSVLVLPSLEEGFGLVVPQALNCGLPCLVSDRVGARDLIHNRQNGSIVAYDKADELLHELLWWAAHPGSPDTIHDWEAPAEALIAHSQRALQLS